MTICPTCKVCPSCQDVWHAGIDPSNPTVVSFYCRDCDGDDPGYVGGDQIKNINQGGHVELAGTRKKPKKSDDHYFFR